jgi:hypothetical protein
MVHFLGNDTTNGIGGEKTNRVAGLYIAELPATSFAVANSLVLL